MRHFNGCDTARRRNADPDSRNDARLPQGGDSPTMPQNAVNIMGDEHESKVQTTRRELFQRAAAGGMGLTMTASLSSAQNSGSGQLAVGAAKRIFTPNPLLPVSG